MTKVSLNTHFLARTAVALVFLTGLIYLAHVVQVGRHARGQLERAARAEHAGDTVEVIASLHRSLEFDPSSKEVRARYGLALSERATTSGQRAKALKVLRQALAEEPGRSDVAIAAARMALGLEPPDPAEATRLLAPVLRQQGDRADLQELLARAQADTGATQVAVQSLCRALELDPARTSSAALLADLLSKSGQSRQAEVVLDTLVKNNPRSSGALLARARHRLASDKLEIAREDLAQARKLAPTDTDVLAAAAALAWRRGDFGECATTWSTVLAQKPDDVAAYLSLVRAERERRGTVVEPPAAAQRGTEVIKLLRSGLKRLPEQPDLLFALADLLLDEHHAREAKSVCERIARFRSEDGHDSPRAAGKGQLLYLQGRIEQEHQRWREAILAFAQSAQSGDLSAEEGGRLMRALASCYAALGEQEEQLAALRQAVELNPTPSVRLELARVLVAARTGIEALPQLRALTALPVAVAAALPLLARALLEENLTRPTWQRNWTEMESVLSRASKSQPVAVALLRCDMHLVRGHRAEAQAILADALLQHPDEPLLWNAEANLSQQDGEAAVEAVLTKADRQLGDRIAWLLLRAERLGMQSGATASRDLQRLEVIARRLPARDRDRLERSLAEVSERRGDRAAVDRICGRILQSHPADLRARQLFLEGRLAAGDDAGATRLVEEMRKREGEDGTVWRSALAALHLNRAGRGDRSGLPEAGKLVQEVRQRRPGWSYGAYLEGRLHDLKGKAKEALTCYRRVLQLGDYRPWAVRRVVELLTGEGRYREANQVLDVVAWHGALERDLWRPAAQIALRAGKPERACELARLAVPVGSGSYRDLIWRGRLLDAAGQPTEAEHSLREAVRNAPDALDGWLALLALLDRQGRNGDADAALKAMRQELPPSRQPMAVARAFQVLARLDEAVRAYRQIVTQDPRNVEALRRLAHLYLRTNQNARAVAVLVQLLDPKQSVSDEDLPELRRQLALAMTAAQFGEDRIESALRLLQLNTQSEGDAVADRRVAALVRGGDAAQRAESLQALERLPGGPAIVPEESLRLAQLYNANGDWPRARERLLGLLEKDRRNGSYMAVLIDGLLSHGKRAEAATWLDRLAAVEPDAARTRELRARLQQKPALPKVP
jgi:tetratricopeptide (TPR) repeat protein